MSQKTLNNPSERLNQIDVEFVNNSGSTLYDGDLIAKDFAGIATKVAASTWDAPEQAVYATNKGEAIVLGVVRCPNTSGIANGERGRAVVRGYHPAVKVLATHTSAVGSRLIASDTDGQCFVMTAGYTVTPGSSVGHALVIKTTAMTTVPAFVDVK